MKSFKDTFSFEKRKSESSRVSEKYKDRVPIIVEKIELSEIAYLDKNKYLVPSDLTIGQFQIVIRKRIEINHEQAIFLFVNNTLPPSSSVISDLYKSYKDSDGFLYIKYGCENTFGN